MQRFWHLQMPRHSMQDDVRLATFQLLLSEEFDMATCLALLAARSMVSQQPPFPSIQFPPSKDPVRNDGSAWLCQAKAFWMADVCLGSRSEAARVRFCSVQHESAVQASNRLLCSSPSRLQGSLNVLAVTTAWMWLLGCGIKQCASLALCPPSPSLYCCRSILVRTQDDGEGCHVGRSVGSRLGDLARGCTSGCSKAARSEGSQTERQR